MRGRARAGSSSASRACGIAGCGPEHFVEPAAGMLVLFPSYMWHGTVPFATGAPRLTAAFDVVPA